MIIERPDLTDRIKGLPKWTMVYGRRKTGKTFLLREFVPHDEYFFVKRDLTILTEKRGVMQNMVQDVFMEVLQRELANGKTLVVDEFHRLGDDFFDLLHSMRKNGKLILVSSTLSLSKKILEKKSPLMGMFAEVPVPMIDLADTIEAVRSGDMKKKELMELALLLREPLTIDYYDGEKNDILAVVLRASLNTIPALIGEIFQEEQRSLSAIYEGVLRAVATGHSVSGDIADHLFSHRLIQKNDPSLVQQYLVNMVGFGVLKKTKVFNKNRYRYRHASHLVHLYYYADEHYNISERDPSNTELNRIAREVIPHLMEDAVREHFAERYGLTEAVIETPDHDVDVCLLKFQKPEIVGEVKWKENVKKRDIARAEEVLSEIEAKRRFLFVPDKDGVSSDRLEVIDVMDL